MSYFDKFMKDLEQRQMAKNKAQERAKTDENNHTQRHRVRLYAERWQNRVKWSWGGNEKKSK
jgi:hypothetical protein